MGSRRGTGLGRVHTQTQTRETRPVLNFNLSPHGLTLSLCSFIQQLFILMGQTPSLARE